MFLLILLLLSICMYASFWWKRRRMVELAKDVPCWNDTLPILGHAHRCFGDNINLLEQLISISDLANQNKGVAKVWLGPFLFYVITNPEDIQTVTNTCLEKAYIYKFSHPWVGEGLATASVPVWKRHYKKLSPAFNQSVLKGFVNIFNRQSSIMVEAMAKELGKEQFDVYTYIGLAALETICQTVMGIPKEQQSIVDQSYLEAVHKISDVMMTRSLKIWLYPQFMYKLLGYKKIEDDALKVLHHVSNTVIRNRKQELLVVKNNNTKRPEDKDQVETGRPFRAYLDLMLKSTIEDGAFTEKEIREEVDTMIAAGHETVGHTMLFTLLLLGTHQEKQQKVYNEIKEIFGNSDRDVTKEDLSHLVYLEAALKETMRLYPVAPVVARVVDREVKLKNYTLPAGCTCGVSFWGLHRHERWGPDYDSFRPERWLEPASLPTHPAAYAPFSFGRRACIGRNYAYMYMKITMVHMLRRYQVFADIKKMIKTFVIFLKPVSGHLIKIEKRKLEASSTDHDISYKVY